MIWLFSLLQIITNIIKKNWEAITETLSKKVKNHTVKQETQNYWAVEKWQAGKRSLFCSSFSWAPKGNVEPAPPLGHWTAPLFLLWVLRAPAGWISSAGFQSKRVTLPQGATPEGYAEAKGMSKFLARHYLQSSDSTMDHFHCRNASGKPCRRCSYQTMEKIATHGSIYRGTCRCNLLRLRSSFLLH